MARTEPPKKRGAPPGRAGLPLQAKLEVGPAHDHYEAEADRIADRILSGGQPAPRGAPPTITPLRFGGAQRASLGGAKPAPGKKDVKTHKLKDEEEEAKPVQRSATGQTAPARPATENAIARMQAAGGRQMPPSLRTPMEAGLGRRLDHVRLHDGPAAHTASRDLGARAFTLGRDVFFGAGQYRPNTPRGQHLLAHELVHTEQQKSLGRHAQTARLQRQADDNGDPPSGDLETKEDNDPGLTWKRKGKKGHGIELNPDRNGGTISLSSIQLPKIGGGFKGRDDHPEGPGEPGEGGFQPITASGFIYKGKNPKGSDTARQLALKQDYTNAAENEMKADFKAVIPDQVQGWENAGGVKGAKGPVYFLYRASSGSAAKARSLIKGTLDELASHELVKIPDIDQKGKLASFDVDHSQESNLGGKDGWENFWLLDQSSNRSSGSKINSELGKDISAIIEAAKADGFFTGPNTGRAPSFEAIKNSHGKGKWEVHFATYRPLKISGKKVFWSKKDLTAGEHLKFLKAMTIEEIAREGLDPSQKPEFVSVFAKSSGGFRIRFKVDGDQVKPLNKTGFAGFALKEAVVNPDESKIPYITALKGQAFRRKRGNPIEGTEMGVPGGLAVTSEPKDNLGFNGYINQGELLKAISATPKKAKGMSPLSFTEAGVDAAGVIWANGSVTSTKLLFPGLEFPIRLYGDDIFVDYQIPVEAMHFGPIHATEGALQIGIGKTGLFVTGTVGVAIDGVGSGMLTATVAKDNTVLSGDFNFEADFLDPATALFSYNLGTDTLTFGLEAGVPEGSLPGVQSGSVSATFSNEGVAIGGNFVLGGALAGTQVAVSYDEATGLSLGADDIPLPLESVPGIASAKASLRASQDPQSGEWNFGGTGTAEVDIAGVTGSIAVLVDGTRIVITGGPLTVEKGPAKGTLMVTATNAQLDENGMVLEGEPSEDWSLWGKGSVEVTFGDILTGSAGIALSPDGSIRIDGSIGLPPTFDVFDKKAYEKRLLHVETPDFPIWGVSVGGIGFGIFAFADAYLDFDAFVGPGQLIDTKVMAAMDLDAPEDAVVTGSATFKVPAGAGLTLDIGGGVRARAAVAFVQGRVGLEGELAIDAAASASVLLSWSRDAGLDMQAKVEADAQPKFRVGVNASITAGVDLGIDEVTETWGPWDRTLGEFGPDMSMGITIPVSWNETDGLGFSLEDIEVREPDIDVKDILKSSFEELV